MDIELVAEGFEFPEGPIAMADGSVILTEIKGQRLTRVSPDGKKETLVETGGGPNGAAIGPDGAIWITNNGGAFEWLDVQGLSIPGPTPASHVGGSLQRFDLATGRLETVYEACEGRRLVGPNDLVFDKQGGVWFTDHGCSHARGPQVRRPLLRQDGRQPHLAAARPPDLPQRRRPLAGRDLVYAADTQLGAPVGLRHRRARACWRRRPASRPAG